MCGVFGINVTLSVFSIVKPAYQNKTNLDYMQEISFSKNAKLTGWLSGTFEYTNQIVFKTKTKKKNLFTHVKTYIKTSENIEVLLISSHHMRPPSPNKHNIFDLLVKIR